MKSTIHTDCTATCPGHVLLQSHNRVGRGTLMPTSEHLAKFVPLIREHDSMTDADLARELNIHVHQLDGIFAAVANTSEDMNIEQEPSVSGPNHTNYMQNEEELADDPMDGVRNTERNVFLGSREILTAPSSRATSQFSEFSESLVLSTRTRQGPRFKLMYVPDPSRKCATHVEAQNDLSFTARTLPANTFENLRSTLPGYVFAKRGMRSKDGVVKVYIAEWVSIMPDVIQLD